MGCVYLATSPSGKQYVGATMRTVKTRWKRHCADAARGRASHLATAIRKYGPDAFTVEVLHEGDEREMVFALEIAEILQRGTVSPEGYNLTHGGDGGALAPSEETRAKLSAASKANWACPKRRAKQSKTMKAAFARSAFKERRSEAYRAAHARPEVKERHAEANARPDVRARRSAATKAGYARPGMLEKRVAAYKVTSARPDVKAKKSAAQKARWAAKRAKTEEVDRD